MTFSGSGVRLTLPTVKTKITRDQTLGGTFSLAEGTPSLHHINEHFSDKMDDEYEVIMFPIVPRSLTKILPEC